ncbi:MAG: hypothetical protein HC923_12205, partial [Myxococcales bacterium]|nr:hypothetical protein [Myxococcales bacterium]
MTWSRTAVDLHGAQLVALVVGIAILSQWIAWRSRVPAIIYLLTSGFAAGAILRRAGIETGLEQFNQTFVPVAAALVLFEGGLNTRWQDLQKVGLPVLRLVSVGLVLTWILTTASA